MGRVPVSLLAAGTPLRIGGILSRSTPPPATGFWKQSSYFGLDFSVLLILKAQFVSDLQVSIGETCVDIVKPLQGCNDDLCFCLFSVLVPRFHQPTAQRSACNTLKHFP